MLRIFSTLLFAFGLTSLIEASPFKLPPHQKEQWPNGLSVFLMPQSEVPLLHVSIGLQGGASWDENQLSGLASYTGEALLLGTRLHKKADLEASLDFRGASFGTNARPDFLNIDLSMAAKDAPTLIPLLGEILLTPTFPEGELIKLKERTVSDLKKKRESPNLLADQFFNKLIFGTHSYAQATDGTAISISRITRQNVVAYYQKAFQPQLAAISVVGDFEPEAMKKLLQATFGGWQKGSQAVESVPTPAVNAGAARVFLVDKRDATETTFRIGGQGVPRNTADWIPLQVINTILGGRFTSLLNEELRVKTGLTYGAKSRFDPFKMSGTFAISSFTANDNSFKALDLALETYRRFLKQGIDQSTLDSAKAYVKGQYPPRFETLDSLAQVLLDQWAYQLPDDVIDRFESEVDALTQTRANDLIRQYFPADRLDILLIGKAASLRSGVQKYGRIIQLDLEKAEDAKLPL